MQRVSLVDESPLAIIFPFKSVIVQETSSGKLSGIIRTITSENPFPHEAKILNEETTRIKSKKYLRTEILRMKVNVRGFVYELRLKRFFYNMFFMDKKCVFC